MAEFSEEEIQAVIKALEKNEKWLSDGFVWYVGQVNWGERGASENVYNDRMRKIAIRILRSAKKAKKNRPTH